MNPILITVVNTKLQTVYISLDKIIFIREEKRHYRIEYEIYLEDTNMVRISRDEFKRRLKAYVRDSV